LESGHYGVLAPIQANFASWRHGSSQDREIQLEFLPKRIVPGSFENLDEWFLARFYIYD
jgi:hypothetical protein